jgi:hypothetical protein
MSLKPEAEAFISGAFVGCVITASLIALILEFLA